jgi:prolyl-tRNA synthetase
MGKNNELVLKNCMRQSKLFTKTLRQAPKDEVSLNAQLLIRAGFVDKLIAGVYTYLPLGLGVLNKIKEVVREEMSKIDGQEILMPALIPKENWAKTGRWDYFDALFKFKGVDKKEYGLGATHEEVITPLVKKFVLSYKDLPCAVYQIQDKFRDEVRVKSGLMRGREFSMKDLYSFHRDEADLDAYYERAKKAYFNIFSRCGLKAYLVEASGGTFSKFSHEFQVLTEYGEDEIFFCVCGRHQNKELVKNKELKCPYCGAKRELKKAIEVGNIFKLKTKYSAPFEFKYVDEKGVKNDVVMGTYGIGPSRVMGAVVEVHHDEKGITWPKEISPYNIHLVCLHPKDQEVVRFAENLYGALQKERIEVLYDDREEKAPGEKLADSDLIGIPQRLVVSKKTAEKNVCEFKFREKKASKIIPKDEVIGQAKRI